MASRDQRGRGTGRLPSQRQLRVGELLRHELAGLLSRGEIHDPVLQSRVVTVSEVSVSPDLRNATAYVMPLGGDGKDEVLEALSRSRRFIRGEIGHRVDLKYVPDIRFAADDSFAQADHMRELFQTEAVQRDLKSSGTD